MPKGDCDSCYCNNGTIRRLHRESVSPTLCVYTETILGVAITPLSLILLISTHIINVS